MPKITSGGASNAREELEPGAPGAEAAALVEAAEVPADAEVGPDAEPAAASPEPEETGGSDGPPADTETAPAAVPPVESMSKSELQDHADSLGLPTSGTKADLAARIVEHHETQGDAVGDWIPREGPAPETPQA